MLSFGIDASLALRIARSSAGLPTGSPPPSRAATVIARVSFEKAAPRRESTIAFLCLMLAHLECPDTPTVYEHRRRRGLLKSSPAPHRGGPPAAANGSATAAATVEPG